MADPSYINSQSVNWPEFYSGILPPSSSAAQPTFQPGMLGRGLPASAGMDRLPSGSAGLPNPSPGSGLTAQQLAAMGGMTVDSRTGQLTYMPSNPNAAVSAAGAMAQGGNIPMPRPRPNTSMEDALIAQGILPGQSLASQQPANPGLGGALIGNGIMSPDIAPQGPPPAGIAPTNWGPGNATPAAPRQTPSGQESYALANAAAAQAAKAKQASLSGLGTNGYVYVNGVNVGAMRPAGMSAADQYALLSGLPKPMQDTGGPSTGTNVSHTPVQQSVANPNGAYGATAKRDFTFFGPQAKPSGGSRF